MPETIKTDQEAYQALRVAQPLKILRTAKVHHGAADFNKRVSRKLPSKNPRAPSAAGEPRKRRPMTPQEMTAMQAKA